MTRISNPFLRPVVAAALAVGAAVAVAPAPAHADASAFLKSLEGTWKGSGTARIPGREEAERIVCSVNNAYAAASSALNVDGDCATTQAKSTVRGQLTSSGSSVSGSLINAIEGATLTKSSGTVRGNQLIVSSSFVDDRTGELTRSRQVIQRQGNGFAAAFYIYDNAKDAFEPAGQMQFTRR